MISQEQIQTLEGQQTPFYFYDLTLLDGTLEALNAALKTHPDFRVHYAMKANVNRPILERIHQAGLGADCVSGGEIARALESGFTPAEVVFAGVGKSDAEITFGLEKGIFCFNVESVQELSVIADLAASHNRTATIALRLNPNLDAGTHHYISTGKVENKFGIPVADLDAALETIKASPSLHLAGLHTHIGSQITDLGVFERLCQKYNGIVSWFEDQGVRLEHLNVGGGLGIDYRDPDSHAICDFQTYFDLFGRYLGRREGQLLHFELGRAIVGQCGNLITQVLYTKHGEQKSFAIVDAGMTELIRPALYQAYHHIENLSATEGLRKYDVVGPVCESSDFFGKDVPLPETNRGDLIAVRSAGAYGEVMTSHYNLRQIRPAMYWDGSGIVEE